MNPSDRIIIGLDIGKVTLSVAVGVKTEDGGLEVVRTGSERHFGKPLELFGQRYGEFDPISIIGIAATGIYGNRLEKPVISGIPEEIAQEYAVRYLYPDNGPINVFRLGGRGFSILTRDAEGRFNYEENDKCSAGAGETIEKICGRMGVSLEEAVESAMSASESIPITARCSVFAKTEITHFANQDEPHEQLLRGYFESVARNLYSLYEKCKVAGPVVLIGNGALIGPISEAFDEMTAGPVEVSGQSGEFEALGALHYAATQTWDESIEWPLDPELLVKVKRKRIYSLNPDENKSGSVIRLEDERPEIAPDSPAFLGIDLGSTGSKAALVDAATGAVIADVYRKTNGNPVEAAKALVAELAEMTDNPVTAIGLTGSGRDAAATVFRAAYSEQSSRIFVRNEIVAHATTAIRYDPGKGKSLSIVEIGGQDAKFINVQDGRILESDMNRACSAGTGSFLEEQAIFYGHEDISAFGEIAASSKNPPDLGQMCTVFVADLAAEALNEGYTVADIFAGFQYSVIVNYKNRVMGNRQFMERIFFQGKPATNPSLAATLADVTGRDVYVPPNPGAMGAIGIALLAGEATRGTEDCIPFDLRRILDARITQRRNFRCKDSKCRNMCRVEAATVRVLDEQRKIVSGGSCPKYEAVSAGWKKLPKDAPNPYKERQELIDAFADTKEIKDGAPTAGIPHGHYLIDYLPFFHTLFTELGMNVKVIRSDSYTFPTGNRRCGANNTCTPTKIMHGLASADVDYLFMPKLVQIPRLIKKSGTSTCPLTQATPEMVEKALEAEGEKTKVLRPILRPGKGGLGSLRVFAELRNACKEPAGNAEGNGFNLPDFTRAYYKALRRQSAFERELWEIGEKAINFAHKHGYPVVLVAGNSHVIHEPIMNAGIHELITRNGAIALPLDCFPIPDSVPPLERVYWGVSNRVLRASIAAARDGSVFPLLIISYGCGPSSFLEHFFNDLLEKYPHTVLESDGHGGRAGYVTRVQAFLHSARNYERGKKEAIPQEKIDRYDTFPAPGADEMENSKIATLAVGPNLGRHTAAVMRAAGYDAEFSGLTDPEGFRMGRETCSGKECLPYQLIWGSFCKFLERHPPENGRNTILLNVTGYGPCRNGMFTLANEMALEKMGLSDRVKIMTYGSPNSRLENLGGTWISIVSTDLLNQMRCRYRAIEENRGDADRLFAQYSEGVEEILERPNTNKRFKAIMEKLEPVENLLEKAALDFKALPVNGNSDETRTVYLCGDIYLRIDEWGSDDLARKLNEMGLHVLLEPFGDMFEFLALYRSKELVEMESRRLRNRLLRLAMDYGTNRMVAAVNKVHPWIKWDNVRDVERASRELLDGTPFTESILTIGSALHVWKTKPIDGVVVVSPWGCGPALISEAQLRKKTEIPLIFVYNDGEVIDEARLEGFAWRLKNRPPRKLPHPAESVG